MVDANQFFPGNRKKIPLKEVSAGNERALPRSAFVVGWITIEVQVHLVEMLVCVALSPHSPFRFLVICVWCCVAVPPIIPSEPTMFLIAHLSGSSLGMKKLVHLGV